MHIYLKVKVTSLAAEARIIRKLERHEKAKRKPGSPPSAAFFGLQSHRRFDVRNEARSACLAYGFLRGVPYSAMEAKAYQPPNWKRVEQLVGKYAEGDQREVMQHFSQWKDAATVSPSP